VSAAIRRNGPFWDAVPGRRPHPPAAATLELIEANVENGTSELAFEATHDFTTPRGDVLEGFLAAMLHDTLGPALIATLEPDRFITTLDLQASFVRPA
jgi:acyl-coenzyme A thioesterase PaaI-like protein